jgi:translation initiation factor 2B subunit (eIF-2B alpha/beta/delta family)
MSSSAGARLRTFVVLITVFSQLHACVHSPYIHQDINFSVIVTEGRPDGTGQTMARALDALKLPVTLVLDSGVAYALER